MVGEFIGSVVDAGRKGDALKPFAKPGEDLHGAVVADLDIGRRGGRGARCLPRS
jgi:hypothetical protein